MSRHMWPLALATFAVGTDGFVIAGLLPAIGADLGVSVATAGQLVTAFAVTFAVGAPVLSWVTSGLDRRTALLGALVVFVVGNALTALAPVFALVLAARMLTALGAATITSSASSTAVALADPARRGRALALVLSGLTLATTTGLPLGTLIGRADWRLTLWAVGAVGTVAAVGVALGVPPVRLPGTGFRGRLTPLRDARVLRVLMVTLMSMAGPYLLYTYIGAALRGTIGPSPWTLTLLLFAWGVGVLAGTVLAGRLADRFPPQTVVAGALVALTATLGASPMMVHGLPPTFIWIVAWGVAVGLPTVPQQQQLVTFAPAASPVLLGLNSSAIYLGIAAGAALGGLAQAWFPASALGLPAAALTAMALPLTLVTSRRSNPRPSTTATCGAGADPVR